MVTTTSVFCDVRTTTKRPINNYELVTDRVMLSDSIDLISFQNFSGAPEQLFTAVWTTGFLNRKAAAWRILTIRRTRIELKLS